MDKRSITIPDVLDAKSAANLKRIIQQLMQESAVTSIVAGTNVTISPSDGLGNVTVNASGGSPLTVVGGTGISVSTVGSTATVDNTGITSVVAGSNVSVSITGGVATVSSSASGSFATATGTIANIDNINFTTSSQNNDTVVTHGLGTTPKLITISITNFQVPSSTGTNVWRFVTLYITFDATGANVSGFSNYFDSGGPLESGGNTVTWTGIGSTVQGTMQLEIVSVGATTFTFRITYSKNNSNSCPQGFVDGITWLATG